MDSVESTVRAYFEALNGSDVDGIVALFVHETPTATGHEQKTPRRKVDLVS